MKLYFKDSKGQDTLIKTCATMAEAISGMIEHQNRCFVYSTGQLQPISAEELKERKMLNYTLYEDSGKKYWVDVTDENGGNEDA